MTLTTLMAVIMAIQFATCPSHGARLLLIVDSMSSHVLQFSRLGLDLARLGHDVRILAPSNARVPDFARKHHQDHIGDDEDELVDEKVLDVNEERLVNQAKLTGSGRFNFTTFHVKETISYSDSSAYKELILKAALSQLELERGRLTSAALAELVVHLEAEGEQLVTRANMEELRRDRYDFVILNPTPRFMVVPLTLGVPYAMLSITVLPTMYRVPRLASFAPFQLLDTTDRLTFSERLLSLVIQLAGSAKYSLTEKLFDIETYDNDGLSTGEVFSIGSVRACQLASLWLVVEDPVVGYPLPLMPNTLQVGDIMSGQPGLPLPPDLEDFVASSKSGVIVVSFGSYIDDLPRGIIDKFCDAFRRLDSGRHVIWKTKKSDSCSGVENVKTVPWIPQNDLLADHRVRLFITHGGMNSMMETVYHAQPAIVFPLYADQNTNAGAAVKKGYAIRMDVRYFTSDSLMSNIEKIFSDEKYQLNARLTSSILRDRRDTPAERVSYMVEHVIKYGDSHLRTGAFELNTIEFLMLDVFAVLYSVVLIFVVIGVLFLRCLYRKCCRRKNTDKRKYE